jgi:hypothetical protein
VVGYSSQTSNHCTFPCENSTTRIRGPSLKKSGPAACQGYIRIRILHGCRIVVSSVVVMFFYFVFLVLILVRVWLLLIFGKFITPSNSTQLKYRIYTSFLSTNNTRASPSSNVFITTHIILTMRLFSRATQVPRSFKPKVCAQSFQKQQPRRPLSQPRFEPGTFPQQLQSSPRLPQGSSQKKLTSQSLPVLARQ